MLVYHECNKGTEELAFGNRKSTEVRIVIEGLGRARYHTGLKWVNVIVNLSGLKGPAGVSVRRNHPL